MTVKKTKITRRDFIKATVATAAAAAATVVVAKEVVEEKKDEANLDDLQVVQAPPKISCKDLFLARHQNS